MPRTITTDQGPTLVSFGQCPVRRVQGTPRQQGLDILRATLHAQPCQKHDRRFSERGLGFDFLGLPQGGAGMCNRTRLSLDIGGATGHQTRGTANARQWRRRPHQGYDQHAGLQKWWRQEPGCLCWWQGKAGGSVLAWNTFKRNFGSHIAAFHRVALVMVDPHGLVWEDDGSDIFRRPEPVVARQLAIGSQGMSECTTSTSTKEGLTGANFPDSRVYRNIRLSGGQHRSR